MTTQAVPAQGDSQRFGSTIEPFRRELFLHAYRMLGSIDDAEDVVQDAFAKAWDRRETYRVDGSVRAWLYRITTNAALDALGRRRRRGGTTSIDPVVTDQLDAGVLGTVAGPEARYELRESISLAFLTALQLLPPRQRAVLLLRDVLGWQAAEVAALLDLSVAATNSALQRARATLGSARIPTSRRPAAGLGALLERYVRAWEGADIAGLVSLLREDALLRMPPRADVTGNAAIGAFLAAHIFRAGTIRRLVAVAANGCPAYIVYTGSGAGAAMTATALLVIGVDADGSSIDRIDAYADPAVIERFGPQAIAG